MNAVAFEKQNIGLFSAHAPKKYEFVAPDGRIFYSDSNTFWTEWDFVNQRTQVFIDNEVVEKFRGRVNTVNKTMKMQLGWKIRKVKENV